MEVQKEYDRYVGIDWATQEHQVCVMDPKRRVLDERVVKHSGTGIAGFVDWLAKQAGGEASKVAVAIETPRGALVESLLERGFDVYSLNPKQLDRFRDRHTVAGAKDDRLDAFVLADSLRTDQECFRLVQVDDPVVIKLRELSRADADLQEEKTRLTNRLWDQLHRYFPQMLALCPGADEPWFWALVELVPNPASVKGMRIARLEQFLKKHQIRRLTASEVLDTLKEAPLKVASGTVEAARAHIELLLPRLRLLHEQRTTCERRITALLKEQAAAEKTDDQKKEHRDVDIVFSMPGVGHVVCATVFAEASLPLKERDYGAFRTLTGVAPVTKRTGKQGKKGSGRKVTVVMRRACNARLRNAVYHWARVSTQCDTASKAQYASYRARGDTHGCALRKVADRCMRLLFAMLRSGTLYDPEHRLRQKKETVSVAA